MCVFLIEINAFIQQILIKGDIKNMYNVYNVKIFIFWINSVLFNFLFIKESWKNIHKIVKTGVIAAEDSALCHKSKLHFKIYSNRK